MTRRMLELPCATLLAATLFAAIGRAEPPAATPGETLAKPDASAAKSDEAAKPKREPIYQEESNGKELIAAAVDRARLEGKHVLIEWGGNWCGWCYKLHDVFHNDKLVAPIVAEEYELVLVDCRSNDELMRSYGGKDTQYAYPHLTILDAEGKVLTNQETGSLEIGPKHDPEKVAAFLKKWQPEQADAEELLAAALRQASDEDKRVLVHVGNPYCGWCKVLTKFLDDHKAILGRDYIDLRVDVMRMEHGVEVAERYLPAGSQGDPWMVILDASGKVVANSVGKDGNIGYPLRKGEIDDFLSMLTATKQRLSDADLKQIRADLTAYRVERDKRQAAARGE